MEIVDFMIDAPKKVLAFHLQNAQKSTFSKFGPETTCTFLRRATKADYAAEVTASHDSSQLPVIFFFVHCTSISERSAILYYPELPCSKYSEYCGAICVERSLTTWWQIAFVIPVTFWSKESEKSLGIFFANRSKNDLFEKVSCNSFATCNKTRVMRPRGRYYRITWFSLQFLSQFFSFLQISCRLSMWEDFFLKYCIFFGASVGSSTGRKIDCQVICVEWEKARCTK